MLLSGEKSKRIRVIGGGLAGPEAALAAALGCEVELFEMRREDPEHPEKPILTPAHQTTEFGELVCSNSLKSESPNTAPWLDRKSTRLNSSHLVISYAVF